MRLSRRATAVGAATVLAASLAACGSSGPTGSGNGGGQAGGKGLLIWALTGGDQKVFQDSAARFNKENPGQNAQVQVFQNDPYKQKLHVSLGSNQPPDVFENWGGGILKSYVDSGAVKDITDAWKGDAAWSNKFFPNVVQSATFGGKVYGVPMNSIQPEVFFYNKDVFAKAGVQPPQTWDQLLSAVQTLKSKGIAPISLGGQGKWPELLYLQYLADRVGGPQLFDNVLAGKKDAWLDPGFVTAATMIQQLIDAGAFVKGYASISFDTGQSRALVYTGKAAMELMGSWQYFGIKTDEPSFIQQKKLGWFPFPTVPAGKGDPRDITGNPANFYSVSSKSANPDGAVKYLQTQLTSDQYIKDLIQVGEVPAVQGIESQLQQSENADWLTYVYQTVKNAPHFQLSWDQALPPAQTDTLLTNIDKLFLKQITPQQFCQNMNAAAGGKS